MGYYMAGDYYAAGGIFGSIGKFIGGVARTVGGVAKTVGGIIPGPVGTAVSTVGGVLAPKRSAAAAPTISIPAMTPTLISRGGGTIQPVPGITGIAQRMVPGGASGYEYVGRRRRRINPANAKALRRAIRRQAGFIKLARRALKGTGYTIRSRGSSRGGLRVTETGPGSVHVNR